MKRTLIIIILFLLLAGVSAYLYTNKGTAKADIAEGGMSVDDRRFAVEDKDDIYKISLQRPRYPKMVFKRGAERWTINDDLYMHDDMVPNLLNVLTKMKVDFIPTRARTETIYKDLDKNAIKIKIYDKDDNLIKSYQVGSAAANGIAVPCLMDGHKQPYMMHIPGFEGSFRTRLVYNLNELRAKDLFREVPEKLTNIEIIYPRDEQSSFILTKTKNGSYDVKRPGMEVPEGKANQKTVERFISQFSSVVAEYNDAENANKEKITSQPLFARIVTTDEQGTVKSYKLYSYVDMTNDITTTSPKKVREDNKFFIVTSTGEFLLVQYRALRYILKHYSFFMVQY